MSVTAPLHELKRTLQARRETVSGMVECVQTVRSSLSSKRTEDSFKSLLQHVMQKIEQLELDPLELPRIRKPPKRLTGPAAAYQPSTIEDFYRMAYFCVLDTAIQQIDDRWQPSAGSGLESYNKLEQMFLTGETNDVMNAYPELDCKSLPVQLEMFVQHYKPRSMYAAKESFRNMSADTRLLFIEVEKLLRLLLVCPATSCEAERSFSALRRIKTWLRNSMTQVRLNAAAICNVHKDRLDKMGVKSIAADFAGRNELRRGIFGHFESDI